MMDLVGLLNSLGLDGLFLVGRDWGFAIAWYVWIFFLSDAFLSSALKRALRFVLKRTLVRFLNLVRFRVLRSANLAHKRALLTTMLQLFYN